METYIMEQIANDNKVIQCLESSWFEIENNYVYKECIYPRLNSSGINFWKRVGEHMADYANRVRSKP